MNREDTADLLETIAGKYPDCRWKITPAVIDSWHDELASVKPLQADKALTRLGNEFEKRPPTAMAFRRLCYQQSAGSGAVRRCGRGGCPLTLSQDHQYACTYHERVDRDRDLEVLDRMRACKLDIQFCFWLQDASPTEVIHPELFGAPEWVISTMRQYPRGESESIADYKNRVKKSVDVLVLGEIPLRGPVPAADVPKQESLKPAAEYEQLAEL